jgi:hypothetical protein
MIKWQTFFESNYAFFFLGLIILILLPSSPIISKVPGQDSGVFLYAGQSILHGNIPYRDFWDHKGPIIYFINALGLLISEHTLWGQWIVRVILLTIAFNVIYSLVKKPYGCIPAAFSTSLAIIVSPILFGGFDSTEEYTLLPQALALYFINKTDVKKLDLFMIGVMTGICFLLRPNLIGIGIAIVVYLFYEGFKNRNLVSSCKKSLMILIGFAIVILLAIFYLHYNGALQNFWEQVFVYNMEYSRGSGVSIYERIKVFLRGLRTLNALGLLVLCSWTCVVFSQRLVVKKILILATIAFAIEAVLSSVSGRTYNHYFITWLLSSVILAAGFIESFLKDRRSLIKAKCIMILSIVLAIILSINYQQKVVRETIQDTGALAISQQVKAMTSPDDYVLSWGPSGTLNFLSERKAPTKYFYQLPFYSVGVDSDKMIREFFADIKKNKPAIIVDTKNKGSMYGEIPTIADDFVLREKNGAYQAQPAMLEITKYIRNHYDQQDFGEYTIYSRKD